MNTPQRLTPIHPSLKQYSLIAALLFVVTLVEFLIILPEGLQGHHWTYTPLIGLSAIKFAAVVLFYMHLKFDQRLLTWVFMAGLGLSLALGLALLSLSGAFDPPPREFAKIPPIQTYCPMPEGCDPVVVAEATIAPIVDPAVEREISAGKEIFLTGTGEGTATPCSTCHIITGVPGTVGILGPDLTHIGSEAATRRSGMSAAEYLEESITDPETFSPEGVDRAIPGLMLSSHTAGLTDADVDALVQFLLSQE